ncbi:MAG TPA: hypothetical protein VE571_04410, partial [Solirubrobacteraceae bacterium]|nr:hypothetical protein [Solirubrobacteraceae bacterium]
MRVAQPRDAADVGAIAELRALWITNRPDDADFESRLAAWLAAEGDRRTTWLAFARDEPAGMVSLLEYRRMPLPGSPASCWGYVSNLFVREPLRARGI